MKNCRGHYEMEMDFPIDCFTVIQGKNGAGKSTIPKAVSKSILIQDQKVAITGISKGSGMIHPNMATMLAFISTDANISLEILQKLNKEITDTTFNCISVDGDTSTNDSFMIAATNQSKHSKIIKDDNNFKFLKSAIFDIALEL